MAKDPAVLWYYQDFLVGTALMTDDEVGKYTRLLCHLADKGSLTETQILRICNTDIIPESIKEKLLRDESGNYYQKRMREEKDKRSAYSESRRKNRYHKDMNEMSETYDLHMENENENENEIKKMKKEDENKESLKDQKLRLLQQRKQLFEVRVFEFIKIYPEAMLEKFFNYWSEMNKSGSQMRWEMEKTWELKRRLQTWCDRDKGFVKADNIITYEELVRRYNAGEADVWQKYEKFTIPGKTKPMWRMKNETA